MPASTIDRAIRSFDPGDGLGGAARWEVVDRRHPVDAHPPLPRLLVVEDDDTIAVPLEEGLTREGFVVTRMRTGADGLAAVNGAGDRTDLVLLDLGLPDLEGSEVCRRLRASSAVPIIVLTARGAELDRVLLLELGADDYVIKPFSGAQIDARIRAVLRRAAGPTSDPEVELRVGDLVIDRRSREVTLEGRRLDLSRKEFDLLTALARRPGEVVSKRDLLAEVWQLSWGGGDRTVDVHLSWLRRKLGETAAEPRYLHSVRGVGIKLVPPATGD